MAGHLTPVAQKVGQAIMAGEELEAAARELLEGLGTIPRDVFFDIGTNVVLVARSGWNPLSRAADYVGIADRRT